MLCASVQFCSLYVLLCVGLPACWHICMCRVQDSRTTCIISSNMITLCGHCQLGWQSECHVPCWAELLYYIALQQSNSALLPQQGQVCSLCSTVCGYVHWRGPGFNYEGTGVTVIFSLWCCRPRSLCEVLSCVSMYVLTHFAHQLNTIMLFLEVGRRQ